MILLAEHDEPSLAAKKKQQHVALKTAASTPKNRVWNFFGSPLGQIRSESDLSAETATGSVQFSYETASGQAYYYSRDHLGSIREMVDGGGNIKTRYSFDPYGKTTTNHLSGSVDATFQYAGYYYHATSGLDLTFFRAYDPTTGRWLSQDLLGEDAGTNLYNYVYNNPDNSVDYFGLCTEVPGSQKFQLGNAGGSGWQLQSYKLEHGFSENYHTLYDEVGGTWMAQVYVLCQCKCGLYGTSGIKTYSRDHVPLSTPIMVADPTATPSNLGSGLIIKSIASGIGKLIGMGAKKAMNGAGPFIPPDSVDANRAISDLNGYAPTDPSQGEWVGGSPCSKLKQ